MDKRKIAEIVYVCSLLVIIGFTITIWIKAFIMAPELAAWGFGGLCFVMLFIWSIRNME